jgi:hypothetical protein
MRLHDESLILLSLAFASRSLLLFLQNLVFLQLNGVACDVFNYLQ